METDQVVRFYVRSFGCPTNTADGEVISGCLSRAGHSLVKTPQDANVLIYNTCAVKSPTENRMFHILKSVPKDKQLIITGCLPLINFDRLKSEIAFDGVLGPGLGSRIVETVRRVLRGEKVIELGDNSQPRLALPKIPVNEVIGIIPTNYGCLGACSYCCVISARGRLRSCEPDEIVKRAKQDLASGAKEIWLTSQDTACYGKDIGTNLADLLTAVCRIERRFSVRVGMMTPNNALNMLDDLVQAYRDEKIFKFLHLPVQSGDNKVLRRMNRFYSVEDFRQIITRFRREIPRLTIATDVICGFPGESREAFKRTTELVEEIQPDIINVSKFSPRPNTAAKEMKQLPHDEVKERSRMMARLSKRISLGRNRAWKGWEGSILIDEKGRGESWIGRNFAYKPIVVKDNQRLQGRFLTVVVRKVFPTYLEAEIR